MVETRFVILKRSGRTTVETVSHNVFYLPADAAVWHGYDASFRAEHGQSEGLWTQHQTSPAAAEVIQPGATGRRARKAAVRRFADPDTGLLVEASADSACVRQGRQSVKIPGARRQR